MTALDYLVNKIGICEKDITQNGNYLRIRKSMGKYKIDASGRTIEEVLKKICIDAENNDTHYCSNYVVMVGTLNHDDFIDESSKLSVSLFGVDRKKACAYAEGNSFVLHEALDLFYIIMPLNTDDFRNMINPMLFVANGTTYKHNPTLVEDDYNIIDYYEATDFIGEDHNLTMKKKNIRRFEKSIAKVIDYKVFNNPEEMEKLVNDFLMTNTDDEESFQRYIPNSKYHHIPDFES